MQKDKKAKAKLDKNRVSGRKADGAGSSAVTQAKAQKEKGTLVGVPGATVDVAKDRAAKRKDAGDDKKIKSEGANKLAQAPKSPAAPPAPLAPKVAKGNPIRDPGLASALKVTTHPIPPSPASPAPAPKAVKGNANPVRGPSAVLKSHPDPAKMAGRKDEKGKATTVEAQSTITSPSKDTRGGYNLAEALTAKAKELKSVGSDKADRVTDWAAKGADRDIALRKDKNEEPSTSDEGQAPAEKGLNRASDVVTLKHENGTPDLVKDQAESKGADDHAGSPLAKEESNKGSEQTEPADYDSRMDNKDEKTGSGDVGDNEDTKGKGNGPAEETAVQVPENVKGEKGADPAKGRIANDNEPT